MDDRSMPVPIRKRVAQKFYHQIFVTLICGSLLLSACAAPTTKQAPSTTPGKTQLNLESPSTPTSTTAQQEPTGSSTPPGAPDFAPPSIDPVTAIPPVFEGLTLPDEVVVWVLLGVDEELPFKGRTDAIHILLINPRLAKASLVSIPSNLFVYIPGYTMQRINVAYALGGITLLRETLVYNFGLYPERFLLAHPRDFEWLVDDLGGMEVSVLFPMPQACSGIRSGVQRMNGEQALCYVSYQDEHDEMDRMRRQQQLLRLIFNNLVYNGNLVRLPQLYASFADWVETDFSLHELAGYIPLALKLADPERINYFMIGWDAVQLWELPDHTQVSVFLPDQAAVRELMQNAVDVVMEPAPLSALVLTLEYQLTQAMTLTPMFTTTTTKTPLPTWITGTPSPTPIKTSTVTPTPLPHPIDTPIWDTETPYP
jgi:LCP family protein required for cell wall assembly